MEDLVVAYLIPEKDVEIKLLSSWQNPHTGFQHSYAYEWKDRG